MLHLFKIYPDHPDNSMDVCKDVANTKEIVARYMGRAFSPAGQSSALGPGI